MNLNVKYKILTLLEEKIREYLWHLVQDKNLVLRNDNKYVTLKYFNTFNFCKRPYYKNEKAIYRVRKIFAKLSI
jgi:hypothetical protein